MRFFILTGLLACLLLPPTAGATNRHKLLHPADSVHLAARQSSDVLSRAVNSLGTPYRWGGTTPEKGFDCSGLVKYAFGEIDDVELPRTSSAMARSGGKQVSRNQLQPGDLLFFRLRSRRIDHVAIYLGGDRFIHAPRRGKAVSIDTLEKPFWKRHYVMAKRVLPAMPADGPALSSR